LEKGIDPGTFHGYTACDMERSIINLAVGPEGATLYLLGRPLKLG
jgi:hypothetical protein